MAHIKILYSIHNQSIHWDKHYKENTEFYNLERIFNLHICIDKYKLKLKLWQTQKTTTNKCKSKK